MAEEMDLVKIGFEVSGLGTKLQVINMTGTEGISQLFRFELTLAAGAEVPFAKVVGKRARLSIRRESDSKSETVFSRWVHGIVGRFQRMERAVDGRPHLYRAVLVPEVAPLLHRTDSRIFQDMDMEAVVDEVIGLQARKGYTGDQTHTFSSRQPPPARDYCVQYGESDWQFVERLLEEEGYYYFFIHDEEATVATMTNRANLPWPIAPGAEADQAQGAGGKPPRPVVFKLLTGQVADRESIFRLAFSSEVCPGQVHLDDYFFQQQKLQVRAIEPATAEGSLQDYIPLDGRLEHHEYPGIYQPREPKAKGAVADYSTLIADTATRRLQELRARALQGQGESTCMRFVPGHYFSLFGMEAGDVFDKTDYLLTTVVHHASASEEIIGGQVPGESHCSYSNDFECVPMSLPYRPARKTPRPAIQGVQTAVVVGPDKEEIYTDEHGRVKVMFRWDRQAHEARAAEQKKGKDKNSQGAGASKANKANKANKDANKKSTADCSCWIRVSQPWAGSGYGFISLPRVGHEVLVSFENGDPDRPIITGSVYHATSRPPLDLPKHKTRSTIKTNSSPNDKWRRSNEIRFEDKKGAEQLYFGAQLNMDEVVGHNHTRTVRNDETIIIKKGDRSVRVLEGHQETYVDKTSTEVVKGDRKVTVTEGSETKEIIKGGQLLIVKKDSRKIVNEGNEETIIKKGKSLHEVKGKRQVVVKDGNHVTVVEKKDVSIEIKKGDLYIEAEEGGVDIECGKSHLFMNNDGTIELKGKGGSISIGSSGIEIKAAGGKAVKVEGLTVDLN